MQHVSELPLEHFVTCSKCIVLDCRCGERTLLLGLESDWHSEEHTVLECSGCGEKLYLEDGRL